MYDDIRCIGIVIHMRLGEEDFVGTEWLQCFGLKVEQAVVDCNDIRVTAACNMRNFFSQLLDD